MTPALRMGLSLIVAAGLIGVSIYLVTVAGVLAPPKIAPETWKVDAPNSETECIAEAKRLRKKDPNNRPPRCG
jgi:hypothetical protein